MDKELNSVCPIYGELYSRIVDAIIKGIKKHVYYECFIYDDEVDYYESRLYGGDFEVSINDKVLEVIIEDDGPYDYTILLFFDGEKYELPKEEMLRAYSALNNIIEKAIKEERYAIFYYKDYYDV